jgi:hypothetical protein
MSPPTPSPARLSWCEILHGSFDQVASALGVVAGGVAGGVVDGAVVPLTVADGTLDIGVQAGPGGCVALATSLLGLPADAVADAAVLADAVGEVANMVAGAAKLQLLEAWPRVDIGLPRPLRGALAPGPSRAVHRCGYRLGGHPVTIFVVAPSHWLAPTHLLD